MGQVSLFPAPQLLLFNRFMMILRPTTLTLSHPDLEAWKGFGKIILHSAALQLDEKIKLYILREH